MDQIELLLSYPRLLFQQKYFIHLAAIIVLGDVLLTQLVVRLVPCEVQQTCVQKSH